MTLHKIVSGGQTGVDRGALDAALQHDFPCGGWCPTGRQAEDGPIDARYPLQAMARGGYRERTLQNVIDSDATLVIHSGTLEGGTELTVQCCLQQARPYELIDASRMSADEAALATSAFAEALGIGTLNVAGPRASKWPGAHDYARQLVSRLITAHAGR